MGQISRTGKSLTELAPDAQNIETSILNPQTLQAVAWDWKTSGTMEMDCFLCHLPNPNNAERVAAVAGGRFGDAATATLTGSGLVTKTVDGWQWNTSAFDADGRLQEAWATIQNPTNDNCGQCHGTVHTDLKQPLLVDDCTYQPANAETATTGQVVSGQRIAESGLNLAGKDDLSRSWDVHAERQVQCTDCHYALNNPAHAQEGSADRPTHLIYDPRRLDISEYLKRPDHNFARGQSALYDVSPEGKGTMRRCESCHDATVVHANWLPYTERHMAALTCESCHIPKLYAPAIQQVDWTVLTAEGKGQTTCRGVAPTTGTTNGGTGGQSAAAQEPVASTVAPAYAVANLISGYEPVLMPRSSADGSSALAPYNLITAYYWVADDSSGASMPVRLADLQNAWFENGAYAPEVLGAFDTNKDGLLGQDELLIDTEAKRDLITGRLTALGLQNPRMAGEVKPYSINHNVARGDWAVRDCATCHSVDSRLAQAITLTTNTPFNVTPTFVNGTNVTFGGTLDRSDTGTLTYQPEPAESGLYIFGHDQVKWLDWLGALMFLATLLAVATHATGRYVTSLRRPRHAAETERVYMYDAYERFWHWLQTTAILLLLFTGLIIHKPDTFGVFAFPDVVTVHNVIAAVLVINAAFSLFWHLVKGEIRQYIPRPYGFFDQAIVQATYYMRGIMTGASHPFEKTKQQKLNPLQQVTYFGLLNVLLPLQIITGALMWGVQGWPQVAGWLGGLPYLAPVHTLVAWLLATFVVAHVYLTTTAGATATTDIKAMVTGWEDVEVHPEPATGD
jgi:thiosulfate reductase cytochrome b subunit